MDHSEKTFRPWDHLNNAHHAYSPNEVLPDDDLVFFLLDTIPQLDLTAFYDHYQQETRGAPPFDVTMMCTLLVYSYCVGVFSSRKIAAACERNLAFMAIVGNDPPNFRTISDFRKIHLDRMAELFIAVLRLAGELGLVKLGNVAIDGTKEQANASRHKAMSYSYMQKEVERLRAESQALLGRAGVVDEQEDAALGSRRGDELPDELKRRQERLQAIEAAMKRLQDQARSQADAERERRREADAERETQGKKRRGREPEPIDETPADKAQTNFTDPESKIMKTSNKGFDYCYNAQAAVDEDHQIILSADVTDQANDKQQAVPMAKAARDNLQAAQILPSANSATNTAVAHRRFRILATLDNGYYSEKAVEELEKLGFDPHIATGRQKHHDPQAGPTTGLPPVGATPKERMAHKLRTKRGRQEYAKRKHIVEPVFGQIKGARGFRRFLVRGLTKVCGEWNLVCLSHNLLKIWRYRCANT